MHNFFEKATKKKLKLRPYRHKRKCRHGAKIHHHARVPHGHDGGNDECFVAELRDEDLVVGRMFDGDSWCMSRWCTNNHTIRKLLTNACKKLLLRSPPGVVASDSRSCAGVHGGASNIHKMMQ